MTLEDAFEIVHDLAVQNIITNSEVAQDPANLRSTQTAQRQACDIVHDFIIDVVCEKRTQK